MMLEHPIDADAVPTVNPTPALRDELRKLRLGLVSVVNDGEDWLSVSVRRLAPDSEVVAIVPLRREVFRDAPRAAEDIAALARGALSGAGGTT